MTLTIDIHKQAFILHPSGAVFWEEKKALLISDVHLGKISHFRKHGVAIPTNAIANNFNRLTTVLNYFNPQYVFFLGDLFHSTKNKEWDLFAEWCRSHTSEIVLIAGNHDILPRKLYEEKSILVAEAFALEDFLLTHHPTEKEHFFNFCGHIHPGIALRGFGGQSLKLPCFYRKEKQLILPAFGDFTGKYIMVPQGNDLVYAFTGEEVFLVGKR